MSTSVERRTGLPPTTAPRSGSNQIGPSGERRSSWRARNFAVAVGVAAIGWGLCGAVIWIGSQFVSMNAALIVHALAAPAIFGSLSWLVFTKFDATSPFRMAVVFLSVVVALDFFVVALLIEGSFAMFASLLGTWLPFALIFAATFVCGVLARAGRSVGAPHAIEAVAPPDRIRRAYDLLSFGYAGVLAPLERRPRMMGLERAAVEPRDDVLEVAVGPGHTFLEIARRVDPAKTVCGVDLSPKMLAQTRRRLEKAGVGNADLRQADARRLPFPDATFDVLYNSYMLDLIPWDDMPVVLSEFRRVLKPGGRLVLVNLSKKNPTKRSWWELLYLSLPNAAVPYLMGGCRPVLMEQPVADAGFVDVQREFVPHVIPTEIVAARKPAADRVL